MRWCLLGEIMIETKLFSLEIIITFDANAYCFRQIPGPPPPKGSLVEHDKALGLWTIKLPSADTVVVKRTLSTVTEHPEGLPGVEESTDFAEHRKSFWSSVKPAHFGVKLTSKSLLGGRADRRRNR
jgi:hypothetical protein